jgi:hypothetical protein
MNVEPGEFRNETCLTNIAALRLTGATRTGVLEGKPRGEYVRLPDANPALRVDGQILGSPPDERTRDDWSTKFGDAREGVLLVFGVGVGHAARHLRDRTSASLVVYEPDPRLLRTLLEAGPCDLGGIPIVTSLPELKRIWPTLSQGRDIAAMVVSPGYPKLFDAELRELTETIRLLVADVNIVENTRVVRYAEWIRHIVKNAELLLDGPPVLALSGDYRGVPAFVVGAGPSLTRNVELLGDASKRGLVFVVDVAGRVLAQHGVEPQFLVCLEGMNLTHHMQGLPFIDRVIRAFSMSANPATLRMKGGPLFPFFEGIGPFSPLKELTGVEGVWVGGSVSTVAFSVAEKLGCSPIVLVGQDLAFTGGVTHAAGTLFGTSKANVDRASGKIVYEPNEEALRVRDGSDLGPGQESDDLYEVAGWGGMDKVPTSSTFNSFRVWFELVAQSLETMNPELRLINDTEGGSHIRGFQDITLADVLRDLPELGLTSADIAAKAIAKHPPLGAKKLLTWARRHAELAQKASHAARELGNAARQALDRLDPSQPDRVSASFAKLSRLEAALKAASQAQPMLEGWSYAAIQKALQSVSRPEGVDMRVDAQWGLEREVAIAEATREAALGLAGILQDLSKQVALRTGQHRH